MVEVKIDDNGIAVITFDDGKANALSPDMLTKLDDAITQVETEAKAIVLVGRPERFSAGFDLKLMMAGPESANALLTQGVKFFGRLFTHPKPIVMACTGHAIAGGVLLLLCADHRVGVAGDYKLGLNETAIGMPLPVFALELAKARLDNRRLEEATLMAKIYNPEEATAVGYLDEATSADALVERAVNRALALAELAPHAYAITKAKLRQPCLDFILDTLSEDLASTAKHLGKK
ncbi:MAG: crotonase/enoyl-CoA hydratase family protein [Myxococcota bacterium]|nr:crotonase/enoyl-CoA hydratase family protein [Myxococcota bacterium]